MTTERTICVAAPLDDERRQLVADIRSAAGRASQADPGDRLDIVRHEALSSQLELWAFATVRKHGTLVFDLPSGVAPPAAVVDKFPLPEWVPEEHQAAAEAVVGNGGALVVLSLPTEEGLATAPREKVVARPPASSWEAGTETIKRRDGTVIEVAVVGGHATEKRFSEQLQAAVDARGQDRPGGPQPIYPTGIQNRVLSDKLRDFVHQQGGSRRVDVPIEYRDGSRARHPFPLRSLKLIPVPEEPHDLVLRFALLSIRHTEMDEVVDGAWLRNAQISQQRPQADTDDLVYGISVEQLRVLTDDGRRRLKLEIFQTGLEPANVGFYRAVVNHLLTFPGSLSVVPQYHQEAPRARPVRTHRNNRDRDGRGATSGSTQDRHVTTDEAKFVPGKVWATRRGGIA